MVSSKELISLRYMIVVRQRRNVCGWQALINLSVKHLADEKKTTLTAIIGKLQSLMGVWGGPNSVCVEMPGENVRQIYQYLDEGRVPSYLALDEFRKALFAV